MIHNDGECASALRPRPSVRKPYKRHAIWPARDGNSKHRRAFEHAKTRHGRRKGIVGDGGSSRCGDGRHASATLQRRLFPHGLITKALGRAAIIAQQFGEAGAGFVFLLERLHRHAKLVKIIRRFWPLHVALPGF